MSFCQLHLKHKRAVHITYISNHAPLICLGTIQSSARNLAHASLETAVCPPARGRAEVDELVGGREQPAGLADAQRRLLLVPGQHPRDDPRLADLLDRRNDLFLKKILDSRRSDLLKDNKGVQGAKFGCGVDCVDSKFQVAF